MTAKPDHWTGLKKLRQKIDGYIADAEKHLGVEHGTIADVEHDNDYLAVIKVYATVEPLLNELLEVNVTRAFAHPKVSFKGGEQLAEFVLKRNLDEKRSLAVEFDLLSDDMSAFIKGIADVRNRYAHNVKNMALSITQVAEKISANDRGARVLKGLCGTITMSGGRSIDNEIARALMFVRLAHFLSQALSGIKPPPSGLFELARIGVDNGLSSASESD